MATTYPVPVFHFQVEWGGNRIGFTEVSGMNIETQVIEYREGNAQEYNVTKQPGIPKWGDITLKRGIVKKDNEFVDWITTIQLNKVERRDLTISLLDENHQAIVIWRIKNAFPTKVEGPSLKSTGNEIAIEGITLAHEGMTVQHQ